MRRSVTSVVSEPDDLEAAMRAEGGISLVTTAPGRFRARITQVALNSMRLLDVEESVARIAFIKVPDDMLLVALSLGRWPDWFWDGQELYAGELATLGPGETAHVVTSGAIHWGAVWLSRDKFARVSRALVGRSVDVPSELCHWRPSSAALRQFCSLHKLAIKAARSGSIQIGAVEAAHGLEQQVLQAVTECLATGSKRAPIATALQPQDLMRRLEVLLAKDLAANMDVKALCAALGVAERLLHDRCSAMLRISPNRYLRLRRLHAARVVLRRAPARTVRIADVAQRFGFYNPGRFARAYIGLFGEAPSGTLRHGPPPLPRHRPGREQRPLRQPD